MLFDVPPQCFLPAPKVTSTVMRMVPYAQPAVKVGNEAAFFRVVRAAFAQRRKTLLNGLNSAYGNRFTRDELREIIESCGAPADVRGERLGLEEFAALAEKLDREAP
ncbi:Ribosomal RNA small subunit methyltransferase A [bioreactor metagenome]|uniref:Ribosomal RNA small subunit methyltransferase A n=1 Tax=bioreactor metagenome TaxID=1076179 RepID=A0A645CP29_9ZZZZ